MTSLRDKPLRIEPSLTRDYINRATKMREMDERRQNAYRHPMETVAYWVALGFLLFLILMNL